MCKSRSVSRGHRKKSHPNCWLSWSRGHPRGQASIQELIDVLVMVIHPEGIIAMGAASTMKLP
jgi:hypothetical protein